MMNEATLEAQLGALLRSLFSAFGVAVTHQVQFTLRLGHHDVSVDGRKGWERRGRADVLLTSQAGPVAVLELKRPGMELTADDRDQALSYARLLTPMPPLVIVSNGTTTKFYTTIDGEPWDPKDLSDQVFARLISGAAAIAAQDRDEAIRSLLGSNPNLWADFLRAHTYACIASRSGELRDLSVPFARGFSVERSLVTRVLGKLRKEAPAVAVVGPPLSGKSVVLKQCCEKLTSGELVPLYIDASSAKQGPLRLLASVFAKNLFSATGLEQVRQWLSTSLRAMRGDTRLVLFLDELVPELNDAWLGDLDELLALGAASPLSVVLALDPNTWQALATRPGRASKTELGRSADVLNLGLLSNREFDLAMQQLFEVTGSQPYFGGQFNIEYREPRVLRVIGASVPPRQTGARDTVTKFSSTSTANEVGLMWRAFTRSNHELVDGLRHLARAYLEDMATRAPDAELQLASFRAAAIRKDVASKLIPASTLEWLLAHSFVSTRLGPNEEILLLPRHLELFAWAAALELCEAAAKIEDIDEAYETLMRRSEMLPLGDIVGAGAIRILSDRDAARAADIICKALADVPRTESVPAGAVVEVSRGGKLLGSIELDEPSAIIGNIHPWLVLAQLAVLPLSATAGKGSLSGWIVATVGRFSGFLRRVEDERWRRTAGFHFHELPGKGSVPCLRNGVVEPIGQAMITGFHSRPEEMIEIAEFAVADDHFHLAWRLNTAAREVTDAKDSRTAGAAEQVLSLTDEFFHQYYEQLFHDTESDSQTERDLHTLVPTENGAPASAIDESDDDTSRRDREE